MKVAVLKGGRSLERQVSMRSGARVEDALACARPRGASRSTSARTWWPPCASERPDVAFIALHGPGGEDGTVQELLEILGIPYTGPGVRACTRSIDKVAAKHELRAAGVPTPDWAAFNALAFRELGAADALEEIEARLGFPLVIKPAAGGSRSGCVLPRPRRRSPRRWSPPSPTTTGCCSSARRRARAGGLAAERHRAAGGRGTPREEDRFSYEARYEIGRTEYVCPAELGDAEGAVLDAAMTDLGDARLLEASRGSTDARATTGPRCWRRTRSRGSRTPRCSRWPPRRRGSRSRSSVAGSSNWR